jgi:uncharacterized protein
MQNEKRMRVLKVQGKGQVSLEPDMLTLSFDVETKARDYEACLNTLNARAEDLRRSMLASGLERTELKTSAFNVRVENQYKSGQHIFVGYAASHRMSIDLPMEKALLNKVFRHIAQGHSGAEITLSFSVKDKDDLRKRVLAQAVQTAKENAETLASAAGVTLGKLQQIDYGWAEVRIHRPEAIMMCEDSPAMSEDGEIEPADVTAEDNVTLVYEIAD